MKRPAILASVVVGLLTVAACGGDGGGSGGLNLSSEGKRGREIANSNGCAACHGSDGRGSAGPGWVGLAGSEVELVDGSTVVADDDYLFRAIRDPSAELVAGYTLIMPENSLTDEEINSVIAYIHDLSVPVPATSEP